ncbi:MAG: hypothetical protein LUB59_04495 [Candidatus Gastranaerophilales bacterium]|nr:hypothetical protein [Candidatus Gastranaerophilales bacterium]
MVVTISSKNNEKTFIDKEIINIGSNAGCDFVLNAGFDFILTLQYSSNTNRCTLLNNFNNTKILFKGQPIGQKLEFDKVCKLMIADSDEFISFKISSGTKSYTQNDADRAKAEIEEKRVSVVKQTGFAINDLKNRISLNFKESVFVHISLLLCSLVTAFGLANYLTGLEIEETKNFIHLPTNIKILAIFALIVFGLALTLKQGIYTMFQNKIHSNPSAAPAQNFLIVVSSVFFAGIYTINLLYYININLIFAILISLFFTGLTVVLSCACGYFKSSGQNLSFELNKYEYREDFELVMNEYRSWIEYYINSLSNAKIRNIKDKLFNLQLKSAGETVLGILTAPFLAYGVSNTLAMCFPDAAGWVRISGLRLSPVFLVLATFLIIFAFFSFVNAFLATKKIQGSNVIKQDGFSNYIVHGVDIFGIQGVNKLVSEQTRSLVIGCSIIFIEFTMNTSYFFTEIGGDLQGILLSIIAALVPTALLIAETYMLSQTKFEIYAGEELIAKIDKD